MLFCLSSLAIFAQTTDAKPQIAQNIGIVDEKRQSVETPSPEISHSTAVKSTSILSRVGTNTDQTVPLTLNEAIRRALENNNAIEIARDDVRFAETQLRSLLGVYDGVLSITPNFSRNSSTGQTSTRNYSANSSFSKILENGGGSYNTFFNLNKTGLSSRSITSTSLSSGATASNQATAGISYTQPLLRNFRVDGNRRQIKIQRKVLQQSDADFRRQTIEIVTQVQRGYWDLVFALRDQQNRTENLNLSKENLRRIEASISAGKSAPLERAAIATELANREIDVLTAAQQVSIADNTLKTLLLKEPTSPQWTQTFVPTDKPVFSLDPINLEDALKDAIENRSELRRLGLQKEVNKINLDYYENQTKPQIDLKTSLTFGGTSYNGLTTTSSTFPIITPGLTTSADSFLLSQINTLRLSQGLSSLALNNIPTVTSPGSSNYLAGGTFRSVENLFRTDAPSFSVGVIISFPLKNQTAKANLAGAEVQKNQIEAQTRSQQQTVVAEVRNAVQAVETSRQTVLTSRRATENAEIQLTGERKLYDAGRSTTFLLFQRENALASARNAEIRAETNYNKALADLQRATSTTFRVNNIEVDSPVKDK